MALTGMERYLVLTSDLDATRDFYQDALGMTQGFRPMLGFPGYWMYIGATPVIHIAEWISYTAHSNAKEIPVTAIRHPHFHFHGGTLYRLVFE